MILTRQFRRCTKMTSRTCSFPGASYSIYTGSCGQQPSLPPSFKAENTKLLLLLLPVQYMHRSQIDMENNKPPSSCISPAATSVSAGKSSWATDIADFLAAPHGSEDMDQEAASDSSISSGFSSSFDSLGDDDASFITSELMSDDDENDGSLQDTACSSAAGSKITSSMENVDMKSKAPSIDEKEFQMPQLAKYSVDLGLRQQVANGHQEVINSCNNNDKAIYECNELRKKGLCLVPISMLIDYLG